MSNFQIVLKNDKPDQYNRICLFIAAINFILLIFYALYAKAGTEKISWLFVSLLVPAAYFAGSSFKKRSPEKANAINPVYLLLFFIWLKINGWIALVYIFLLIIDIVAKRELRVFFYADKIVYPSFPKKDIPWSGLQNVVLKDGLLTLDFKDDKLLQAEIDESRSNVDEIAFDGFCKVQLGKK